MKKSVVFLAKFLWDGKVGTKSWCVVRLDTVTDRLKAWNDWASSYCLFSHIAEALSPLVSSGRTEQSEC